MVGLARSTFFYHIQGKSKNNSALEQKIVELFHQHQGKYGYRRITIALREYCYVNHKKVLKVMQSLGLKGKCKARKFRTYRGEVGKIAPDLLKRDFYATQANEKWVTDVTELKCEEGKLYLSPIKDLFNGEIIAYDIHSSPNFEQISRMLGQAVKKLPKNATPILHSDQGWQYQMMGYQEILKQHGIVQSMSRKGNCLDNSAMESFFARLKTECYLGERFKTFAQLKNVIDEYIRYYNEERIQLKLNGLSPIQYRNQSLS